MTYAEIATNTPKYTQELGMSSLSPYQDAVGITAREAKLLSRHNIPVYIVNQYEVTLIPEDFFTSKPHHTINAPKLFENEAEALQYVAASILNKLKYAKEITAAYEKLNKAHPELFV